MEKEKDKKLLLKLYERLIYKYGVYVGKWLSSYEDDREAIVNDFLEFLFKINEDNDLITINKTLNQIKDEAATYDFVEEWLDVEATKIYDEMRCYLRFILF